MVHNYAKTKEVRHNRVLDVRKKIGAGWTTPELMKYIMKIGVTKVTAMSYIDEAAEPYRIKYQKEQNKNEN